MLEDDPRRYVTPLRAAGLLVLAAAVWTTLYVVGRSDGPGQSLWDLAPLLAGFFGLGFLILAATDRVAGARQYLTPNMLIVLGVLALLLVAGYLLWARGPSRDPDWLKPLLFVTNSGFSWLLLLYGAMLRDERARSYGTVLGSLITATALGVGLYRADTAFVYPVHTFIQLSTSIAVGLVVIAASTRRWDARTVPGAGSLMVAFTALGVIYVVDTIWWYQQDQFRILAEIAIRQLVAMAAVVLVGVVMTGPARPRAVAVVAAVIALAAIGSSISTLGLVSENRLFIFVIGAFQPIALSLLALALSLAFASNRTDDVEVDDPDAEGDFGPPLTAWRET